MYFIGIDLGSTNIKTALYNQVFEEVATVSRPVTYIRESGVVEFDALAYAGSILDMLAELVQTAAINRSEIVQITLTGQAESLVVLDRDRKPLMNAISWMDERSVVECQILQHQFPGAECYQRTGQLAVLPTWPATKILWLQRNRQDIFRRAAYYVLLKDYLVYRLTGKLLADRSIATFSFYTDIYGKSYWPEMLQACGIREEQLPPLAEPCTVAGALTADAADRTTLAASTLVNIGTLDHFAGMIGTGNLQAGDISLSIGTVTALATMARTPLSGETGIAMHYGFIPDTYIMLSVAESGGISLEWFKRTCLPQATYDEMNRLLAQRELSPDLIFLPYLVGANAPECDTDVCGVFYGLRFAQDAFDLAYAVMEGVAYLIRRNCQAIQDMGTPVERIIATGGGAKSPVWCQLLADICGVPVDIPEQQEAATLGAAMIGAVSFGLYAGYAEAAQAAVSIKKRILPRTNAVVERKYRQFLALYAAMKKVREMR